ncbi:MAG: T9SS type A sorting domain-containing protein [Bacteroidetes bacterium]|nr:T9SS type A sorting domain-containing protein [Bacteroidota bacterium]
MKTVYSKPFRWLILALQTTGILVAMILFSSRVQAQTMPAPQALPYSQNFSSFGGSTTVYPAGWQGWTVANSAPSATGRTAAPTGDKTIAGGTAASTGSGAYDYNGKIGFLSIASLDVALCLAVNTTGNSNIKITFDAMTIRNLYTGATTGTTNFSNGLVLQYRVGTGATAFTNLPYSPAEYITGTTAQTTGTTGIDVVTGLNAILPSSCENQPIVQIRWIYRNVAGLSGSRPSVALDNILVQQVPVTFTSGWPKAENPTASGFTAKTNINTPGTTYFVVLPNGASAPTAAQVKAGQNASGASVASNEKGSIVSAAGATEYMAAVSGLASNTTYSVYFVAEGNSGASLQASPVLASVTTISSASAPVVTSPTATSITNNTAVLGGNITSDGGSAITDRGTVWNTTSGVTISNNLLSEGTAATGIFSHTRSSLPPKTKIYYAAYATNNVGSTLSSESYFYTMADEPTTPAGSFAVNPIPGNYSSLNLTWTPATGADGYIIFQRLGASAPGTPPSDVTGYTVGNTLGTGTVAAIVLSGSATSQVISGLASTTQYTFRIYPFGYDGANSQTFNYLTLPMPASATGTTNTPPPTVYTWTGASSNDWTVAGNWNPARTTPFNNDIMQFNLGGSLTVINVPTQTVGQMLISNNTAVTLQSAAAVTLSLGGGTGADLDIAAGSALNIGSTTTTNTITIALATGTTGNIAGSITFNGDVLSIAHRLTAVDASSIIFQGGSVFTAGANFSGNAFGTTNNSSVVFESGSTYIQNGGANPFGASYPGSAVVFHTGSLYKFTATTGGPSYSGRTYANFENDAPTITQNNQGSNPFTCDNYTVTSGIVNWDFSGGIVVKGNISVASAATLTFGNATKTTNLTFSGTAVQTITGTGNMSFGANGTLTVNNAAGVELYSTATLNNLAISTGTLTIKSGASVITSGTVSGTAIVERFLTKYTSASDQMYHYISSPVNSQAIVPGFVNLPNTTDDFYSYDEVTNKWINTRNNSGSWNTSFENNFIVGKGYMVAYPVDVTKSFTGVLNTGSLATGVDLPALTYTAGKGEGFNFLGNPYASAIDWDNVTGTQYTNLDNAVYVWDNATQTYLTWVSGAGSLTDGIIPAMQGFMVKANAAGASLTLETQDRVHGGSAFYKSSQTVDNLLRLKVTGNNHQDEAFVRFIDDATSSFDSQWDAYKLAGGPAVPNLYTQASSTKYSVNAMPINSMDNPVSLNLEVGANTSYTLSVAENSISPNIYVTLEDLKTGASQRLNSNPDYSFTAAPGDDPNRFRLHFKDATSIADPDAANNWTIYSQDGVLTVLSAQLLTGKVNVTDMEGRMIASNLLKSGEATHIDLRGHSGIYIVSVITSKGISNEKIIVK